MNALRRAWDRYVGGLTAGAFWTDENGATVFFPYGVLGSGYAVTESQAAEIRQFLARLYAALFLATIILVQVFGPATLLLIPPALIVHWLWSRRVVAGLSLSELRMTSQEVGRRSARTYGRRRLIVLVVISVAFAATSIGVFLTPNARLAGVLGFVVFGFASYWYASLLVRYRHEPSA